MKIFCSWLDPLILILIMRVISIKKITLLLILMISMDIDAEDEVLIARVGSTDKDIDDDGDINSEENICMTIGDIDVDIGDEDEVV